MKRQTFKKITALILGITTCVPLAACSSSDSAKSGGDTEVINLWMAPNASDNEDQALWDSIVAPFEKEHNVDVKVTVVPWDNYETKLLTGVASGDGPDVAYTYTNLMADYVAKGQLVDMTDMVTSKQKDNFYFLDKGQIDGKQYGIPLVAGGARLLVYNKDVLAKAGVDQIPVTWEDFKSVGTKIKNAGFQPLAAPWGSDDPGVMNGLFFPFVWQAGGKLFSDDGTKTLFDSPQVIKAATYINELKDLGIISPNATGTTDETTANQFTNGQAAFIIGSDQSAPSWKEDGINYGFTTSLKDVDYGTFMAADCLSIFKQAKDPQLAYDLISFITSGEQMAKFHEKANFAPVGADEKSTYPEEFAKVYSDEAEKLHSLPNQVNAGAAYRVLYKNLQQMLNGKKTPEQACKDAAAEANELLNK
ncbi:ABC transporter substrate-binding protein [Neoactinobaculum massilliense]|uniref:ABC transporter substrate-binding protein n=1 Tax=Neoactinobaculum massilliense TaxID=2364794 RepID=UPI000F5442FA|nr:sugar ABC transporter substrate-binding protein [Neoactinobaculum massilliense]